VLPVHPRAAGARRKCLLLYFLSLLSSFFFFEKRIEFLCEKTARIIFTRNGNEYLVETFSDGERYVTKCRRKWQPEHVFIPPDLKEQLMMLCTETKNWIVADEFVFFLVDIDECSVLISGILMVVR
jgi:hypothetical protein